MVSRHCPMCQAAVQQSEVTDWCPLCGWQKIPEDELSNIDKAILKNEKNHWRILQERKRKNENIKRSYKVK